MSTILEPRSISAITDYSSQPPTSVRLAVIGCGPRGTQCLEAMRRNLSRETLAKLEVTVFEPCDHLGAGCVYDPRQPHVLRMNFAAKHIEFWTENAASSSPLPNSFMGWLNEHYPEHATKDQYVPRAIVGEYLHECYLSVERSLQETRSYKVVHERVNHIRPSQSGWEVSAGDLTDKFDLVVVATGHEGLRRSQVLEPNESARFVFPVQENLSEQNVAPGSSVLIRGFGLTALDAVLALTEGRSGLFVGAHENMEYRPSGREPSRIVLRSRSGRPMLAKPTAAVEQMAEYLWKPFRQRINALNGEPGTIDFQSGIWSIVHDAAAALLGNQGYSAEARDVAQWYRNWSRYRMDSAAAIESMRQSVLVSTGQQTCDIAYALGEAWRKLYPEIVALVSYGGMIPTQWPTFRRVAAEMERIAFGPPARSVQRLLTLIEAGVVELANQDDELDPMQFDVHVDAVIAAPHQPSSTGPLAALIADGLVELDEVTGAVKVDTNGETFHSGSTDTTVTPGGTGLYLFGRATEGWVVGNDTLSRTLHGNIEQWSKSLEIRTAMLSNHE